MKNSLLLPLFTLMFAISVFSCKSYDQRNEELRIKTFEQLIKKKGFSNLKILKQVASSDTLNYLFLKRKSNPTSVVEFDFNDDGSNELISAVFNKKTKQFDIAIADIITSNVFLASDDIESSVLQSFKNINSLDWITGNSYFQPENFLLFSEGLLLEIQMIIMFW